MSLIAPKWIKNLTGSLLFYSILPNTTKINPEFDRIARFAPIIGLLIGCIQAVIWILLSHIGWPKETLALICVALGIWITGGLHFDGLMDTADGIGAGEEKCLQAMQDSRVGASGVTAIVFFLLVQISALIKLDHLAPYALINANFWSRCAPLWAIKNFPYLHKNGPASFHHKNWKGWQDFVPSTVILIPVIVYIIISNSPTESMPILLFLLIGILPSTIIPHLIGIKLKGHSGDSYGASVVTTETFTMLLLAMIF